MPELTFWHFYFKKNKNDYNVVVVLFYSERIASYETKYFFTIFYNWFFIVNELWMFFYAR